ncbi:MAG: TrmH family RNA methyltransferase [Chloroflexota bacterium]
MSRSKYLTSEELLAEEIVTERRLERVQSVVANRQRGLMIVMEDVYNPHNLAAIARSCDAFGVQQIAFTVEDHDLFDPLELGKVASSSASKWLDYRIFEEGSRTALTALRLEGWHIAATVVNEKAQSIYDVDFSRFDKLALLVGNEREGLSTTSIKLAHSHIYIPMMGMIRSFNVSVATAVTLAEITRQRKASNRSFTLPPAEAETLLRDILHR